jgi:homocysteine S-methyltransferase
MNAISFMNYVTEMNGDLGEDGFFIGGALNPYSPNIQTLIERVKKKQENGAEYLLTQPVYNEQGIETIALIRRETGIKVLGGIMPLVSLRNAQFLHYEFPGISIPEEVMSMFHNEMSREESEQVGVHLAIDFAKKMVPHVDGLYFMTPFNRATMIEKVIKGMRL